MRQSERIIINPNLPENPVSLMAVSSEAAETIKALSSLNIRVLPVQSDKRLPVNYNAHPDLHYMHYGQSVLYSINEPTAGELKGKFDLHIIKDKVGNKYPYDVSTNAVRLNNLFICNEKSVSKEILEKAYKDNLEIINVKQGYTKCSICIVDENSIITDDESIYKSVQNFINDVLLISKDSIRLKGTNYGFIGGCTGKIDNNTIAFNGRIDSHKDSNLIIDFLDKHNCKFKELLNERLTDIGSMLPLTEYC